jgi:hypothetical protein
MKFVAEQFLRHGISNGVCSQKAIFFFNFSRCGIPQKSSNPADKIATDLPQNTHAIVDVSSFIVNHGWRFDCL